MWGPTKQGPGELSHSAGPGWSRAARPSWSKRGTPHAVMSHPPQGGMKRRTVRGERSKIGRRRRRRHRR